MVGWVGERVALGEYDASVRRNAREDLRTEDAIGMAEDLLSHAPG